MKHRKPKTKEQKSIKSTKLFSDIAGTAFVSSETEEYLTQNRVIHSFVPINFHLKKTTFIKKINKGNTIQIY